MKTNKHLTLPFFIVALLCAGLVVLGALSPSPKKEAVQTHEQNYNIPL